MIDVRREESSKVRIMYDKEENVMTLVDLYGLFHIVNDSLRDYDVLGEDLTNVHWIKLQYFIVVNSNDYNGLEANEKLLARLSDSMLSEPEDIARLYSGYISSAEFINQILDGSSITEPVCRQYLKTTVNGHNLTVSLAVLGDMDETKIREKAKELIASQSDRFQFAGEHELKLVSDHTTTQIATDALEEKNAIVAQMYSINNQIANVEKNSSENDIAYAKAVIDEKIEMGDTLVQVTKPQKKRSIKLYVVLGFLLGGFLMCFYYACRYALSSKLQEAGELQQASKIPLLETVEDPSKRKRYGIDKVFTYWLHSNKRKLTTEQQVAAVVSAISLYCEQNDIKSLCFTSSLFGNLNEEVISFILNGLKLENITGELVDDISYDKKALRACAEAGGTVLIEQVDRSLLGEIEKEIKTANEYQVNIIGSVIFE